MRDAWSDGAHGDTARGAITRRVAVALRVARGERTATDPPRTCELASTRGVPAITGSPVIPTPRIVSSEDDRHPDSPFEQGAETDRRREVSETTGSPSADWSIDQVIEVARLVGREAIGSLSVAPNPWPTDGEFLRYRRLAAESGYTLAVSGSRLILVPMDGTAGRVQTPSGLVHIRSAVARLAWRWPFAPTRAATSSSLRTPVRERPRDD